jgi:hypothetical protein
MRLRTAPRHVDIAHDRRIAIHGEAGIQIRDLPRAHEKPLRFEAGQHGRSVGAAF